MKRHPWKLRRFAVALAVVPSTVALVAGAAVGVAGPDAGAAPRAATATLLRVAAPQTRVPPRTLVPSHPPHAGLPGEDQTRVSAAPGAPRAIAKIRAAVAPGLVDIDTVLGYQTEEAAGTGMVLTPTGRVLTNNHVIDGATKITATDLGNGRTYSANVLGYSPTRDVAVLQLTAASGLATVHLGDSSKLKVGDAVVGIGNAGGLGGVPSAAGGSVIALGQAITASDAGSSATSVEHLSGLVETNADIQPGDSGGPLVTASGAVVGMDTAGSSTQGAGSGQPGASQSYAIPIDAAMTAVHEVVAHQASASLHIGGTAFLGVYVGQPHSAASATATPWALPFTPFPVTGTWRGLLPTAGTGLGTTGLGTTGLGTTGSGAPTPATGALVVGVIPGSPAAASGLAATDTITAVNGSAVTGPKGLSQIMLGLHPGISVTISWVTSSGSAGSATVTLASGPPQ